MIRLLVSTMLLFPIPAVALGMTEVPPGDLCRAAIASAEHQWRVPDRLMAAIGVVESGKRDASGEVSPWPWTINAEGVGHWFATKAEAIAAVQSLQARGVRSIDVGCMQINLMHHADAFSSLDQAFDPLANTSYAGRFLTQLYEKTGTWPKAAAGYHSLTPEVGAEYERRVMAVWQRQPGAPNVPEQALASAGSAVGRVGGLGTFGTWSGGGRFVPMPPNVTLYGTGGGRIIPMQAAMGGGAGMAGMGRSLASYRAAPTRLAMVAAR